MLESKCDICKKKATNGMFDLDIEPIYESDTNYNIHSKTICEHCYITKVKILFLKKESE